MVQNQGIPVSTVLKMHCFACFAVLGDQIDVNTHLELGKKFLQEGQLSEALTHYSAACGKGWSHMLRPFAMQKPASCFSVYLAIVTEEV